MDWTTSPTSNPIRLIFAEAKRATNDELPTEFGLAHEHRSAQLALETVAKCYTLEVMAATTPLRLDSTLVNDARSSADLMERSTTAQVEFWAKLGRVAESVFAHDRIRTLKQTGRIRDIDALVAAIDTPAGRKRALAEITRHGTPIYGTDPAHPGLIVETKPDGTTCVGRFVNRKFVPRKGAKG